MNEVFLEVMTLGLTIALSPMTVIAAILMLLSPRGRGVGLAFLIGWVAGLTIAVVVIQKLANPAGIGQDGQHSETWVQVVRLTLGCLLLLFGILRWRRRKPASTPSLPAWMGLIERLTPAVALGVGTAWAGPTPKNLVLLSAASVTIIEADLPAGEAFAARVILVVTASLGVAIPVVWSLYAGERANSRLASWRAWLTANNAAIMAIVFAAAGVLLIGKSLDVLLR
jgi:hypothetical protein